MDTGHYICRNKYYGRGLSIDGFRQALFQYLHNGVDLRIDLFESILLKLRGLLDVLERQASYRFYSSSLLIIYDGKECPKRTEGKNTEALQEAPSPVPPSMPKVDVRMIDFAHSTFKGFRDDPTVHDGPDKGYVLGLKSLIRILEGLSEENQTA